MKNNNKKLECSKRGLHCYHKGTGHTCKICCFCNEEPKPDKELENSIERVKLLLDGVKDDSQQYLEWRADLDVAIKDLLSKHFISKKEIVRVIEEIENQIESVVSSQMLVDTNRLSELEAKGVIMEQVFKDLKNKLGI